jgi:hypothetical protein
MSRKPKQGKILLKKFTIENSWPNILHIDYSPKVVSKLPKSMQNAWKTFMSHVEILKSHGVETCIVPLSFDAVSGLWWRDYPVAYCKEKHPDWRPDKIPHLIVTLRVDDKGFAIPEKNEILHIDHENVKYGYKSALLKVFTDDPRFTWNGRQTKEMSYRL